MTGSASPRVNLLPHPLYERGYPAFPMVPCQVADRPSHLRVLRALGLYGPDQVVPVGVMTHAHLSTNMQRLVREFPCDGQGCTGVLGVLCPFRESSERCPYRAHIRRRMVWMCDSGAFSRQGAPRSYPQLFELYGRLGVDYGIIADVLRDSAATLESARLAMAAYPPYRERFSLVGVAKARNGRGLRRVLPGTQSNGGSVHRRRWPVAQSAGVRSLHESCERVLVMGSPFGAARHVSRRLALRLRRAASVPYRPAGSLPGLGRQQTLAVSVQFTYARASLLCPRRIGARMRSFRADRERCTLMNGSTSAILWQATGG